MSSLRIPGTGNRYTLAHRFWLEIRAKTGIIIGLPDPSDPRNPNHKCHDDQWMEVARAIGRAMAREQFAKDHADDQAKDCGAIRQIFKRPPKR
jgi:hypothetical protein